MNGILILKVHRLIGSIGDRWRQQQSIARIIEFEKLEEYFVNVYPLNSVACKISKPVDRKLNIKILYLISVTNWLIYYQLNHLESILGLTKD